MKEEDLLTHMPNTVKGAPAAPAVDSLPQEQASNPKQQEAARQPDGPANGSPEQPGKPAGTSGAPAGSMQQNAKSADTNGPTSAQKAAGLTRLEREACLTMLNILSKYKEADPFRQPVDWRALNIPDYPQVIKQPMDLKTCREKVRSGVYNSIDEWRADMALIWSNCRKYNGEQHLVAKLAEKLEAAMQRRMDEAFEAAARELAGQQQKGEWKGGRGRQPRELALLGVAAAAATDADNDSPDEGKPVRSAPITRPSNNRQLDQARSTVSAGGVGGKGQLSPDNVLRLSLKRAPSASQLGSPDKPDNGNFGAAAANSKRSSGAKRKLSTSGAGNGAPGVDTEALELLTTAPAAQQLGVADADDLAFLAVWKTVMAKKQAALSEAGTLRQTNKKLKRSLAIAEEHLRDTQANLESKTAQHQAAETKLGELQQQHKQLDQQFQQQREMLEHQRQLLEQQQQMLRQVLKQQQHQPQPQQQPDHRQQLQQEQQQGQESQPASGGPPEQLQQQNGTEEAAARLNSSSVLQHHEPTNMHVDDS